MERASIWVHARHLAETKANDLQDAVREKILDQLHAASDASAILLEKGQKFEDLVQRATTMVDESGRLSNSRKSRLSMSRPSGLPAT